MKKGEPNNRATYTVALLLNNFVFMEYWKTTLCKLIVMIVISTRNNFFNT